MEKIRIKQVEPRFAQELETPLKDTLKKFGYSIPESFRLRVSLLQANGRKKRSDAGADTWAPESERMEFWLEPSTAEKTGSQVEVPRPTEMLPLSNPTRAETSQSITGTGIQVHPSEVELLRALDRAESTPGWSFVSLKKFRDEILPLEDVPFLRSDVERQNALRYAIDKRLILRGKAEQMFMALDKFRAAVLIIAGGFHSDFSSVLSAANKNKTRVVVLADTGESAQRYMAAGAHGVVYRNVTSPALVDCVRKIARGESWVQDMAV